jgi:hypothetical protein
MDLSAVFLAEGVCVLLFFVSRRNPAPILKVFDKREFKSAIVENKEMIARQRSCKRTAVKTSGLQHLPIAILFFLALTTAVRAQQPEPPSRFSAWLPYQAIPSLMVISDPGDIPFAFEWEATPLLYSFGMTRLVSPWHFLYVPPPARFTGSIELKLTGQLSTRKMGASYFGSSAQLIGHFPLIERGEYLGLNVGVAKYAFAGSSPWFKVVGVTTLFGFVEFNVKHSSDPQIWLGTFELRFF